MKHLTFLLSILLLGAFLFCSPAGAASWRIDADHSAAHFAVEHMGIVSVRGFFSDIAGEAKLDKAGNLLSLELTIGTDSIETGVEKRNAHLRNPDFFDTAKYPNLTFHTKTITPSGPGTLKVVGNLHLHGITKEITVDMTTPTPPLADPWGNTRRGTRITGLLNRTDFGMTYNAVLEGGTLLIGEKVEITVELELIQKKEVPTP